MDLDAPVINIVTSKPRDLGQEKRKQQVPNRNRVIQKSTENSARRPPVVNPTETRTFPTGLPVHRNVAETNSSPVVRAPDFHSAQFSQRDKLFMNVAASAVRPQPHFKEPNRFNGHAKKRATDVDESGGSSVVVAVNGTKSVSETSPAVPPKPERKKQKLNLSVPSSPKDVSSNWEGLKKSLGIKEKPEYLKKPTPTKAKMEMSDSTETEVAIPTADSETFVKTKSFSGLTKTVAMDCEFVGIGPGGRENMLGRVSVVNLFGHCIYDKFVKPTELVKDYRTHVSGVRPQDLKTGEDFKLVQKEVSEMLQGRILVGHAVRNDLEVLLLSHPKHDIRDTSRYKPFRTICKGGTPSLKKLTEKVLGFAVQTGEHDSVQDAQATMRLYTLHKKEWESKISFQRKKLQLQKNKKPALA